MEEVNGFGGNFTLEDVTGYQVEETELLPFEVRLILYDKHDLGTLVQPNLMKIWQKNASIWSLLHKNRQFESIPIIFESLNV